ncbi:hypothetical protein QFC21_000363 [Naganishia friedmannii]|uniref:Uncharacterized protein n=1 Tax=Naganishia friedmannii TaxID=89922 RepID=A0ACC2WER8_9TREE|nr:hypothetical protein QFC21_000363 [Naganishia friedmannii]
MVVSTPFINSIDIIGTDKILHFPTSAAFSHLPQDLLPFDQYEGKGIYVPLALTAHDDHDIDALQSLNDESASRTTPPLEEIDGDGLPTIHLRSDGNDPYAPRPFRTKLGAIARVPAQDAWWLGRDATFREPEGTSRGGFTSAEAPWERGTHFRAITGLTHDAAALPHLRTGTGIAKAAEGHWIVPREEEEECSGFIREMVRTMKRYWKRVMGEAHGRSHLITAKESFGMVACKDREIINTFLHYLSHHRIFTPQEPYLLSSLSHTISLSTLMQRQINIAQLLCDTLPGTKEFTSWHAYALDCWVRAPALASDREWQVNGELMRARVEGTFTPAREESMARNLEEGLQRVQGGAGEEDVVHETTEAEAERVELGQVEDQDEDGYTRGVRWTEEDVAKHPMEDDAAAGMTDLVDQEVDGGGWEVPVMDTLTKALGSPATEYSVTAKRAPATYLISKLSSEQPDSVTGDTGRLDVRFMQYARRVRKLSPTNDGGADRGGDGFLWLTLTPETSTGSSSSSSSSESASPPSNVASLATTTTTTTYNEVVVLVDTYEKGGSALVHQIDSRQAEGMGMTVGLICIGPSGESQREGTWIVETLEEVRPRF